MSDREEIYPIEKSFHSNFFCMHWTPADTMFFMIPLQGIFLVSILYLIYRG